MFGMAVNTIFWESLVRESIKMQTKWVASAQDVEQRLV